MVSEKDSRDMRTTDVSDEAIEHRCEHCGQLILLKTLPQYEANVVDALEDIVKRIKAGEIFDRQETPESNEL